MHRLVLLMVLLGGGSSEVDLLREAGTLRQKDRWQAALEKYEKVLAAPSGERAYAIALHHAVDCEWRLGRYEQALDRARAAKLPQDRTLRDVVVLLRLEMLRTARAQYGNPLETEEGAQGSAKLSRAQAKRELEAQIAALMADHAALAQMPLSKWSEFAELKDVDPARYATVWDLVVLRLADALAELPRDNMAPPDPMRFVDADFPRQMAAEAHPLLRLGALYEDSGERWQLSRVLIPRVQGLAQSPERRKVYLEKAAVRLRSFMDTLKTPVARSEAGADVADLLRELDRPAEALSLCDKVLAQAPEADDAAAHCRRVRHAILDRELQLQSHAARMPGRAALHVRAHNLGTLFLRLYRVDPVKDVSRKQLFSNVLHDLGADKVKAAMHGGRPAAEWRADLKDAGDHRWFERDLDVPAPGNGAYLVVVSEDGKFAVGQKVVAATLLDVTDLTIARAETQDGVVFYAFDAASGGEVAPQTTVHVGSTTDWDSTHREELHTGADGVAIWHCPDKNVWYDGVGKRGDSWAWFPGYGIHYPEAAEPPVSLFLATDRPIYRPGQTVKVRVTAIQRGGDTSPRIADGRKIALSLLDANGREVQKTTVESGNFGSAHAEFAIAAGALLGQYQLIARLTEDDRSSSSIVLAVEEYKRPEFEITLDALRGAAKYEKKATLWGRVSYYFGGPAPDVKVNFVVTRKRWIPWWAWQRGESGGTEIARGTVKADAQGKYEVTFVPAKDPSAAAENDSDLPRVDDFEVHVFAYDAGGRTLEASRTLRLGEKSLLVALQGNQGFWMSDEAAHLSARLLNLDEAPVAGQGSWELLKLGPPKEAPKPGTGSLERVLRDYPTEGRVAAGTIKFGTDKPADLALPKVPSGGYRLIVLTKDPFGQTVRGVVSLLVADTKTRALALPLPPLALLHHAEVEPGGTARMLAGGTFASGTYHVETWRGRERHMHRVERGAPVRVIEVAVGAGERGGLTLRWMGVAGLQIVGGEANVRVPRRDKDLVVKFDPRPDAVEPGAKVRYGVRAVDGRGKPVAMEALVAVYDRSLELYARGSPPWVDVLYAPPPEPPVRADAQIDTWGTTEPFDRAVEEAIEKAIRKSWKPHPLPQFAGEPYDADRDSDGIPDLLDAADAMEVSKPGYFSWEKANRGVKGEVQKALAASKHEGKKSVDLAFGQLPAGNSHVLAAPALRTNMAETALFLPYLHTGADGRGSFEFTAPERLTSWRLRLSGLGRAVEAGTATDQFTTRKQLMVRVEIPRFLREGDRSQVTAVVHNETDKSLEGRVELAGADTLGVRDRSRSVTIPAHRLASVNFGIAAPEGLATYMLRATVTAGALGDAEERELPVLPSRERLIASRLLALRGEDAKELLFEELASSDDRSLRSESLVVSVEPQLALSILRSIPSLVEYPYECVEQTIDRYVPLAIISEIYKKHPDLARASTVSSHRKRQHEPWLADDSRRMTALVETPWLLQSQGGSDDERLLDLLDPELVSRLRTRTENQLLRMQNGDGSFAWFPGGRGDFYMTLLVLDGLANLTEFGIDPPRDITRGAIAFALRELPRHRTQDEAELALFVYGAHVLTAFDPRKFPEAQPVRKEAAAWMRFVLAHRAELTPLGRAYAARTLDRLGDHVRAMEWLESALDGSRSDPLIGVYFAPERYSWRWYSDSVEKHAYLMRLLFALKPQDPRIAGMAQWLLWNRKGSAWHSTKASAAAVYALLDLMQKQGALDKPERFHVKWGARDENLMIRPDDARREPLFWKASGAEVTPKLAKVRVEKTGPGIAFASATWLYSSTKLQAAHGSDATSIERRYFLRVHKPDGDHLAPLASGARVHVGDEIEVRLVVKTRSAFEYVQIKEPHGAGFEETALRSGWRWGALSYYLEPRDSLINFFVGWMPQGEFELRHLLRPTTPGHYRIASAVLQSMYSPDITAYSAGMELEVER